jgi:hypothetical protein
VGALSGIGWAYDVFEVFGIQAEFDNIQASDFLQVCYMYTANKKRRRVKDWLTKSLSGRERTCGFGDGLFVLKHQAGGAHHLGIPIRR